MVWWVFIVGFRWPVLLCCFPTPVLGKWSQKLYWLFIVIPHFCPSVENHFPWGMTPLLESWMDSSGRMISLAQGAICFGHCISTSRALDLKDVECFCLKKQESRTWLSCSGLSQVTCFLDFPLNLLSPLSWWWIRKADQPFSPLDYKYLNTSVESFNMLYHTYVVYIFSCWPGRNSFIWFPPSPLQWGDEESEN